MSEQKNHEPAFNTQPAGLEKTLANFYSKTLTLNLPVRGKTWLADNVWWLSLIGGVLSLWGAWNFWSTAHYISEWASQFGVNVRPDLGVFWYISLAIIVAEAVLLLLAITQLKDHKKSGWNLLFYVSLISVVSGLIYLLIPGYGFGSLISVVIGTLVGWFFLFQIRSYFTK